MQLHWRHRKHCLWKILLFVSTFSKGQTFFSQLSHTSAHVVWISCTIVTSEEDGYGEIYLYEYSAITRNLCVCRMYDGLCVKRDDAQRGIYMYYITRRRRRREGSHAHRFSHREIPLDPTPPSYETDLAPALFITCVLS